MSEVDQRSSAFGDDAGLFVDFLLSLVAIFALIVSVTADQLQSATIDQKSQARQLSSTTARLRSANLTRDFILLYLRCGTVGNIDQEADSCKDNTAAEVVNGGSTIVLDISFTEGTLIIWDVGTQGDPGSRGVFAFGSSKLTPAAKRLVDRVRPRLECVVRNFASEPLAMGNQSSPLSKASQPRQVAYEDKCVGLREAAAAYASAKLKLGESNGSGLVGTLGLLIFEGHSDGSAIRGDTVPEERARSLLVSVLTNEDMTLENDSRARLILDDFEGTENAGEGIASSEIFRRISFAERLRSTCFAGRAKSDWSSIEGTAPMIFRLCNEMSSNQLTGLTAAARTSEQNPGVAPAPKLFALSSYGRYRLRAGELNKANPQDRRVEVRVLLDEIPHRLVGLSERLRAEEDTADNKYNDYRDMLDIFSEIGLDALERCGIAPDANCLLVLDCALLKPTVKLERSEHCPV